MFFATGGTVAATPEVKTLCADESVPPGYVVIKQFTSPQCAAKTTIEVNAMDVDLVRNDIVSCTLPDYENQSPPTIAYQASSTTYASDCAANRSGGNNAYILKPPLPFSLGAVRLSKTEETPFCFGNSTAELNDITDLFISDFPPMPPTDDKFVVKRRFYTDLCPEVGGLPNAMVIKHFPYKLKPESLLDHRVIGCTLSLKPNLPAIWESRIVRTHDDKCGHGTELNAISVLWLGSPVQLYIANTCPYDQFISLKYQIYRFTDSIEGRWFIPKMTSSDLKSGNLRGSAMLTKDGITSEDLSLILFWGSGDQSMAALQKSGGRPAVLFGTNVPPDGVWTKVGDYPLSLFSHEGSRWTLKLCG